MVKNLIQNIFSIKNEGMYKIISIFYIKIKFKTKLNICKTENKKLKIKNNNFKDEIFRLKNVIKECPDLYEKHVLNYEKEQLDKVRMPLVKAEINKILSEEKFPMFSLVEIETINRCVGECAFCPVNRHDDPREFKLMEEKLFNKIIRELKELKYDGRVCLFSNNEPLMDKRIYSFAEFAKKELPNCHFSFFTNGILLNLTKFNKLIENCDTFCIDIYYDKVIEISPNIKPIIDVCRKNSDLQKKVKITFVDKNAIRNNRGGQSKNRFNIYKLQCSCLLPFKQVIIRPDGKLSLCCNDALGNYTLGDVSKEKLLDIWHNKAYNEIRNLLQKGRSEIKMCEFCDNFGGFGTNKEKFVFTEKEFLNSWKKVEEIVSNE